jgi:uncharacterized protein YbaP (TraB family)
MVLFYFLFSGSGQPPAHKNLERSLLWEVSGNGLAYPSYLYGTYHNLCRNEIKLSDSLLRIISEINVLYLEAQGDSGIVISDFDSRHMLKKTRLDKLIGKKNYKAVRDIIYHSKGKFLSEDSFLRLKPIIVERLALNAILNCTVSSYDDSLKSLALSLNKSVAGLEIKPPHGFYAYEDVPLNMQAMNLEFFLGNIEKIKSYKVRNLELYRLADLEGMLAESRALSTPDNIVTVLDDRNKRWLKLMGILMKENKTLFAFGAAHLAGEFGVINLLRRKGYSVRPVL